MNKWEFEIQGSKPEPYKVICKDLTDNLVVECDCTAGGFGKLCKHKTQVLLSEIDKKTSLGELFLLSGYGDLLSDISLIEAEIAEQKKILTKAKVALTKKMKGQGVKLA